VAAAKHMVKGLAVSKNPADGVMFCLSTSNPQLTPHSSPETGNEEETPNGGDEEDKELMIVSMEDVICQSNSSSSASDVIEIDYLYVVDDVIAAVGHSSRASTIVHGMYEVLTDVHGM
jgi:exocyst complex component 7